MFKLQKLRAEFVKPLLSKKNNKHIRISFCNESLTVENVVKGTKRAGRMISDLSIEWDDPIILPVKFNKEVAFEIYDKHEFGYNPQELETILEGRFKIEMGDQKGTWKIYNRQKQIVGYLEGAIKSKVPAIIAEVIEESEDQTKHLLKIKSIIGRFPFARFKKAYIKIRIGQQTIETKQIKSRKNQIVCIEPFEIEKGSKQNDARVEVYGIEDGKQFLIGEGIFYLVGRKPPKKVIMSKDNIEEAGQVFIESKILLRRKKGQLENSSKSLYLDESISISNIKESSTIENEDVNISRLLKSKKDVSVLYRNNNVPFPKEERFKMYKQKINGRVTYLEDRDLSFKSPNEKGHYRGASFGYGGKTDFSKGKNHAPGVGRYKLPSIWDRY